MAGAHMLLFREALLPFRENATAEVSPPNPEDGLADERFLERMSPASCWGLATLPGRHDRVQGGSVAFRKPDEQRRNTAAHGYE